VTPLWTNHATPFLRWIPEIWSALLPSRPGHRGASGALSCDQARQPDHRLFKIRGVNVNHAEIEDMMFRNADVLDFQAVLGNGGQNDRESLRCDRESRLVRTAGACAESRQR